MPAYLSDRLYTTLLLSPVEVTTRANRFALPGGDDEAEWYRSDLSSVATESKKCCLLPLHLCPLALLSAVRRQNRHSDLLLSDLLLPGV